MKTKLRELPPGIEPRDERLVYSGRVFEGARAQIEAATDHLNLAHAALRFGPYGCEPAAITEPVARRLAELGRDVRNSIAEAHACLTELRAYEEAWAEPREAKKGVADIALAAQEAGDRLRALGAALASAGYSLPERDDEQR